MKLTGDDCPLLFGKWKPDLYYDFTRNQEGEKHSLGSVNSEFFFDFGYVKIVSTGGEFPSHFIAGSSIIKGATTIDDVFNIELLEMFKEAKSSVAKKIEEQTKIFPELCTVDVESYSSFRRALRFSFSVDNAAVPISDTEGRLSASLSIYNQLKEHITKGYGLTSEKQAHKIPAIFSLCGIMGSDLEEISLRNGIILTVMGDKEPTNAGTIYGGIFCNQDAKKEDFLSVLKEFESFMNNDYHDLLVSYSGNHLNYSLKGQGVYWQIDFSSWKPNNMITGGNKALHALLEANLSR